MHTLLTTLLISLLLLASASAGAKQISHDAAGAGELPAYQTLQSKGVSLSDAVEQVRRQYKGRIVNAETIVNGNGETHVIKVLTEDGKVKTVRIAGKRNG